MKTFLAVLLLLTTLCYESYAAGTAEIFGTVDDIDYGQNIFTVAANDGRMYTFHVNDLTDIDIENQNYMRDKFYQLEDMRTGDWVQVEYFVSDASRLIADEVDVFR